MKSFYKFLIIHRNSGLCIFEQTFHEIEPGFDSSILSGYLFAIHTITDELTEDAIEFIQLKRKRICYNLSLQFIMILITSSEIPNDFSQKKLNLLQKDFSTNYQQLFINEFSGDVSPFQSFVNTVEMTLQQESQYFSFVNERAKKLESFFQTSKCHWDEVQGLLHDRINFIGKWTKKKNPNLNSQIEEEIAHSREFCQDDDEKDRKKNWI